MGQPTISIVIPAFNEAARITQTLTSIRCWLDARRLEHELLVCADGTDGTRERTAEWAAGDTRVTVLGSPDRLGKGRGIREGVLRSRGEFIGFLDADYKTPIDELDKLLPLLEAGEDVVIGSRKVANAQIKVAQPLYRRVGSRVFGAAVRTLMGLGGIQDTQCGFKFFRRDCALTLFSLQRIDGYMFDVEVLRLARRLGYRIREVGVCWNDDGDTRYNPLRGTLRNVRELIRICLMRYPNVSAEGSCDASVRRRAA